MRSAIGLLLALAAPLFLLAPTEAEAKIYKCVGADGGISYSQRPCAAAEKTGKIMDGKSHREHFDCRVVRAFSKHIAGEMKAGATAEDLFAQYGGVDSISPTAVSVINFVLSHKKNLKISLSRIASLSGARCDAGSFSRDLGCDHFPRSFLESKGGCSVVKRESNPLDDSLGSPHVKAERRESNLIDTRVNEGSSPRTDKNAASELIYNVRSSSPGQKQNECRVAVREKITALQERMRSQLPMKVHESLYRERSFLRETYEAC